MASAARKHASARKVMSPRFPSGVATTYNAGAAEWSEQISVVALMGEIRLDSLLSWLSRFGASAPGKLPPNAGVAAEDFATRHLQAAGLKIVERNYRVRGGEIDIVA